MRVIHFVGSSSPWLEPLCRAWGSMDTHWTEDPAGVTCGACLDALRDARSGGPRPVAPPGGPPGQAVGTPRGA